MLALSYLTGALNRLLPFTRPGTPWLQDVLHTLVLCTILWFAPRILEKTSENYKQDDTNHPAENRMRNGGRIVDSGALNDGLNDQIGGEHITYIGDTVAVDAASHSGDIEEMPQANGGQTIIDDPGLDLANEAHERPSGIPGARNVGKKKAKSLARKDQRRAYHEFMRSQGDAQRARNHEIEAAQEQEVIQEKEQRAAIAAKLDRAHRAAREKRKEEEAKKWQDEIARRKDAVKQVRESMQSQSWADLGAVARRVGGGVDTAWVEKICRAEGIMRETGHHKTVTMITKTGFMVQVGEDHMKEACRRAAEMKGNGKDDGTASWAQLGAALEDVVRRQSNTKVNLENVPEEHVVLDDLPPSMILDLIPDE